MTEKPPRKFVCTGCGSENVLTEAHVAWSVEDQEFKIVELREPDSGSCHDCNDNVECDWVDMDVKDYAIAAIKHAELNQGEAQ